MDQTALALSVTTGVLCVFWTGVRLARRVREGARSAGEAAALTGGAAGAARVALLGATTFGPAFLALWLALALYVLAVWKVPAPGAGAPPEPSAFVPLAGLACAAAAHAARVAAALAAQRRADVVFLDWEAPRGPAPAPGLGPRAPSAWRMLHVAAAWGRLATARRLSLAVQVLAQAALMDGAGLQWLAVARLGADLAPGPRSPVLLCAANGAVWLALAAAQLALVALLAERCCGESPSAALVDLATVAKVSVLVMDARYHGWYVHANAPHEHADASMAELAEKLGEEAAAVRTGRGLPGCAEPACQTFELHVPAAWRDVYDRVYRRLLDAEAAANGAAMRAAVAGGGGSGGALAALLGGRAAANMPTATLSALARTRERVRRLGAGYAALQHFLKGFIGETDADFRRIWRERTLTQRMLDMPPDMMQLAGGAGPDAARVGLVAGGGELPAHSGIGGAAGGSSVGSGLASGAAAPRASGGVTVFVCDHAYRFERTLFRGLELDLLVWDAVVYCAADLALGSPTLAALVTYAAAATLAYARRELGRHNIARKSLIDVRFLS